MSAREIKPRALATGLASFLPGMRRFVNSGSGGTCSARYCYSVWMRHLVRAAARGIPPDPQCVAELGPGDSLGVGLAAVLSGAQRYIALDAKAHANIVRNLEVFEQLVALFSERAEIPDDEEFPAVHPKLSDYWFPSRVLSNTRLSASLAASRIAGIRDAIGGHPDGNVGSIVIEYMAPWNDPTIIMAGSVDLLISQAVLEHVDDVEGAYRAMHAWIRPGGYMSHSIDFQSHNLTRSWNGHWTLSDPAWRLIRGMRPYLINRQPLSSHLDMLAKHGFQILSIDKRSGRVEQAFRPAKRFRALNLDDLTTSGVFIQAKAT